MLPPLFMVGALVPSTSVAQGDYTFDRSASSAFVYRPLAQSQPLVTGPAFGSAPLEHIELPFPVRFDGSIYTRVRVYPLQGILALEQPCRRVGAPPCGGSQDCRPYEIDPGLRPDPSFCTDSCFPEAPIAWCEALGLGPTTPQYADSAPLPFARRTPSILGVDRPRFVIAPFAPTGSFELREYDRLELVAQPEMTSSSVLIGTPESGRFVVEWRNVRFRINRDSPSNFAGDSYASFQVHLLESGGFELHYGPTRGTYDRSHWRGQIFAEAWRPSSAIRRFHPSPSICTSATHCGFHDLENLTDDVVVFREREVGVDLFTRIHLATMVTAPGELLAGQLWVRALGTATIPQVGHDLYLSRDGVYEPGRDIFLGSLSAPANGAAVPFQFAIPTSIQTGLYFLGARIDPSGLLDERNEQNNDDLQGPIVAIGNDLAATILDLTPGGRTVLVRYGAMGTLSATITDVRVDLHAYFLTRRRGDERPGQGDPVNPSPIASTTLTVPGGGRRLTEQVVPISAGSSASWVTFCAEVRPPTAALDFNSSNNRSCSRHVPLGDPDLRSNLTTSYPRYRLGDEIELLARIENAWWKPTAIDPERDPAVPSPPISANLLFSTSSESLPTQFLTSIPIESIPAPLSEAEPSFIELSLTVTATPAGYLGFALVLDPDNLVWEGSPGEGNNRSRTVGVTVFNNPLTSFELLGFSGTRELFAGTSALFDVDLANHGEADGTVRLRVFMSQDHSFDRDTDPTLGEVEVSVPSMTRIRRGLRLCVPNDAQPQFSIGLALIPEDEVFTYTPEPQVLFLDGMGRFSGRLHIHTEELPPAVLGVEYEARLEAEPSPVPVTWALASGQLPGGLVFSESSGVVSGVAERRGTARLLVRATDHPGGFGTEQCARIAERSLELYAIRGNELEIPDADSLLPPAYEGARYERALVAFGGAPPYRWLSSEPERPEAERPPCEGLTGSGLTLGENGVLSGVVERSVDFCFTVTVSAGPEDKTARLYLPVVPRGDGLRFLPSELNPLTVSAGTRFRARLEVADGQSPYSFSTVDMPPGLVLDCAPCSACTSCTSTTVAIEGVLDAAGSYVFAAEAQDQRGDSDRDFLSIEVWAPAELEIVTKTLPSGRVGEAYGQGQGVRLRHRGSLEPPVRWSLVAGTLPPGLALVDGRIAGVPEEERLWSFEVQLQDSLGRRARQTLGIRILSASSSPNDGRGDGCACLDVTPLDRWSCFILLALLATRHCPRRRERRLQAWLFALPISVLLLPISAEAQTEPYVAPQYLRPPEIPDRPDGFSLIDVANFRSFANGGSSNTINAVATVTLPFAFLFYDEAYQSVQVTTTGLIALGEAPLRLVRNGVSFRNLLAYPPTGPSEAPPNGYIAPIFGDFRIREVSTWTEGPFPNRRFVIDHRSKLEGLEVQISFRLILHEGPLGRFDVLYYEAAAPEPASRTVAIGSLFESPRGENGGRLLGCERCTIGDIAPITQVTYRRTTEPDVQATHLFFRDRPRWVPGGAVPVEVVISNTGPSTLEGVRYRLLLAGGETVFPAPGAPRAEITIAAGEMRHLTPTTKMPFQLPPAPPSGLTGLVLSVEHEEDRIPDNNSLHIPIGPFLPAAKDFQAVSFLASVREARPGDTIAFDAELSNLDPLLTRSVFSRIALQSLSTDTVRDLGTFGPFDVPASTHFRLNDQVRLPDDIRDDDYRWWLIVDPEDLHTDETTETNNRFMSDAFLEVRDDRCNGTVQLVTEPLPPAFRGAPFSTQLRARCGDGRYTFSSPGGAPVPGLRLSDSGWLQGEPDTERGTYPFSVTVTSGGASATSVLRLEVRDPIPQLGIGTERLPPAFIGHEYPSRASSVREDALPPIPFVGSSGRVAVRALSGVPPGLSLSTRGVLRGVPTMVGDYALRVRLTDATTSVEDEVMIFVGEPGRLHLAGRELPDARLGHLYDYSLREDALYGDFDPETLRFAYRPDLPPGITLSPSGTLVGRPSEVGTWTFVLEVTDGARSDANQYTLTVRQDVELSILPEVIGPLPLGGDIVQTATISGGLEPFLWAIESGDLPPGIEARAANETLHLTGRPEEVGTFSFTLYARDRAGRTGRRPITLEVLGPAGPEDQEGCGCRAPADRQPGEPLLVLSGFLLLALIRIRPRISRQVDLRTGRTRTEVPFLKRRARS